MSDPFSYLKLNQELAPYFQAIERIDNGEYVSNLNEIQNACIRENHRKLHDGDKGLECVPNLQMLFKITSEKNEKNKEETIKKTLEKKF